MGKRGPKAASPNWDEIEKLAQFQCTQEEIAWFCGLSVDTLERACRRELKIKLAEFIEEKRSKGKSKLRVRQLQLAYAGNPAMLIFLGKQYLGQSDKVEQRIDAVAELVHISDEEIERRTRDLLQRVSDATTKLPAPEDID